MAPRQVCSHEHAKFHSVQHLDRTAPVELWHCPTCRSTISGERIGKSRGRNAAAA